MPALTMKSRRRGGGGKVSSSFNGHADPYYADPEKVSVGPNVSSSASVGGGFFGGGMGR